MSQARGWKGLLRLSGLLCLVLVFACSSSSSDSGGRGSSSGTSPTQAPTTSSGGTSSGGGAGSTPSASAQVANKSPYKIGFDADISAAVAYLGKPQLAGLQAWADYTTKNGGIKGHPIQIVAEDHRAQPPVSAANVKKLIEQDKVLAIVGGNLSTAVLQALPAVEQAATPVPYLGIYYSDDWVQQPKKWYFGVPIVQADAVVLQTEYIKTLNKSGGKARVATLTLETPAANQQRVRSKATIEKNGWELVAEEQTATNATDLTAQALKIADANPDYVVSALTAPVTQVAIAAFQKIQFNKPIINYPFGSTDAVFKAANSDNYYAIRDLMGPAETDQAGIKEMMDAAAAVGKTADAVDSGFTNGWVAGLLLGKALEKCGDDCADPARLRDALEQIGSVDTKGAAAGPIAYSATDHRGVKAGRIYKWDAGKSRAVPASDALKLEG